MKIVEASDSKLVLQVQKYRKKGFDIHDSFQELSAWLGILILLTVIWYQSAGVSDFVNTLKIGFCLGSIYLVGLSVYSFTRQRDNFFEVEIYTFDRITNSLQCKCRSVWGSTEIREICLLSDVEEVFLEILGETSPKEPTLESLPTEIKTSYKVNILLVSGVQKVMEYNSLSVFSKFEEQAEFRNLITQTEDTLKTVQNLIKST